MWTAEKELKLLELIQERLQVEVSNRPELLQKFGYKKQGDLISMKLLALISDENKQILLNSLVDTKESVVKIDITEQSRNMVNLNEALIDLQNLKEA